MRRFGDSLVLLILCRLVHAITYPEYYLSNYCGNGTSVIRMGKTPYFEHTPKRLTTDSFSIARVTAAEHRDACDVVRNCSIYFIPPAGHALLVTALGVDNGNDIGSLAVHIDHRLIWRWDDRNEFNRSRNFRKHSLVDGLVKIAVTVESVTTVWRQFKVSIVLTAFKRISEADAAECTDGFHFNCGNGHCIRRAFECDGYDNCGNNGDETFCGLDPVSACVLFTCLAMCLGLLVVVFVLDSRPDLVMRLLHRKLIDDPVAGIF